MLAVEAEPDSIFYTCQRETMPAEVEDDRCSSTTVAVSLAIWTSYPMTSSARLSYALPEVLAREDISLTSHKAGSVISSEVEAIEVAWAGCVYYLLVKSRRALQVERSRTKTVPHSIPCDLADALSVYGATRIRASSHVRCEDAEGYVFSVPGASGSGGVWA